MTENVELLKSKLNRQRRNLEILIESFVEMETSYNRTVPKTEFDALLKEKVELEENFRTLNEEFQRLCSSSVDLIDRARDLIEERDRLSERWSHDRSILTPRPDWDKVSNVFDGGKSRWKIFSEGRTSNERVECLIEEIRNGNQIVDESNDSTFFNRKMTRRETTILIREIWAKRTTRQSFVEFIESFLENRFQSETIAREVFLNLQDAAFRYQNNRTIRTFWSIVTGQIEELHFHHERKLISDLLEFLVEKSNVDPISTKENLFDALKSFFPQKTDEDLTELVRSASEPIDLRNLFVEDEESRFSEFLSLFIEQIDRAKLEYIRKLKEILVDCPMINVNQFKRAVRTIDPHISENEILRYVDWTFSKGNQQIFSVEFDDLFKRFENCLCFQH